LAVLIALLSAHVDIPQLLLRSVSGIFCPGDGMTGSSPSLAQLAFEITRTVDQKRGKFDITIQFLRLFSILQAVCGVPMNTTTSGLKEIFDEFDEDKNGQISKDELKNGILFLFLFLYIWFSLTYFNSISFCFNF